MGVSTDGIIAWGVDLGEYPAIDHEDAPDTHCLFELSEWIEASTNIECVIHCSAEAPMLILATNVIIAPRGYPMKIGQYFWVVDDDEQEKLDAAMLKIGLQPEEGQWLLCSYWS